MAGRVGAGAPCAKPMSRFRKTLYPWQLDLAAGRSGAARRSPRWRSPSGLAERSAPPGRERVAGVVGRRLRTVSPVVISSRRARSANPAAPMRVEQRRARLDRLAGVDAAVLAAHPLALARRAQARCAPRRGSARAARSPRGGGARQPLPAQDRVRAPPRSRAPSRCRSPACVRARRSSAPRPPPRPAEAGAGLDQLGEGPAVRR